MLKVIEINMKNGTLFTKVLHYWFLNKLCYSINISLMFLFLLQYNLWPKKILKEMYPFVY